MKRRISTFEKFLIKESTASVGLSPEHEKIILQNFKDFPMEVANPIIKLLNHTTPEDLYSAIRENPSRNEILSEIREKHPHLWDKMKGFGKRSSLSADMGDLFL